MDIILWVLLGALAGFVASFFKTKKDTHSVWNDMGMGIAGSVTGGLIMTFLGKPGVSGFNLYSVFVAILASIIVIGTARRVQQKHSF